MPTKRSYYNFKTYADFEVINIGINKTLTAYAYLSNRIYYEYSINL